jgi:hypothetical protein
MEQYKPNDTIHYVSEQVAHQLYDGKSQKYYTRVSDGLMVFFPPNATLLLSKLIDLHSSWTGDNDWFYCTQPLLLFWTGLTISQYRTARNQLCDYNLIEKKVSGSPPKEYFKINFNLVHLTAQTGLFLLKKLKNNPQSLPDITDKKDQFLRSLLIGNLKIDSQETSKLIIRKPENSLNINNTKRNNTKEELNYIVATDVATVKKDKLKPYIPIAFRLGNIITSKKKINITQTKINGWAKSIKMLHTVDGVQPDRISAALDWYENHFEDDYVPVIESGKSLREKFLKLEAAIERGKKPFKSSKLHNSHRSRSKIEYKQPKIV